MQKADYIQIIKHAWREFDDRHEIRGVYDVSMYVSTNQVYKISFYKREPVFANFQITVSSTISGKITSL